MSTRRTRKGKTRLQCYVENLNVWRAADHQLSLDTLTKEQAQQIYDYLEDDLSPENISHDGELSAREIRAAEKEINRTALELFMLGHYASDPSSRFSIKGFTSV